MSVPRHSRREIIATAIMTGLGAVLPGAASAAPLREIVLTGPPAGPSITLVYAVATGMLSFLADKVTFKAWRNPDEMRAGLTSGTTPLVIMPTATAANLHNRGLGLKLVNVMTNGLLFIIAAEPALTSLPALKGRKLAVPFRNDTPDFVIRRLLAHHGLVAGRDLQVDTTGSPIEATQLVLAGRMDAAIVPEPAATAALLRGVAHSKSIHRVMDIQVEWAKVTGGLPILPQAGLAVTESFWRERRPLVERMHAVLIAATAAVNTAPGLAAAQSAAAFELPQPVIERAIPHSKLVATAARDARADLERLYQTIAADDPTVIGGKLPGAEFYL